MALLVRLQRHPATPSGEKYSDLILVTPHKQLRNSRSFRVYNDFGMNTTQGDTQRGDGAAMNLLRAIGWRPSRLQVT